MENEKFTRRDFLKLTGLAGAYLMVPKGAEKLANAIESWPKLNVENLPTFYKDVLNLTPKTDFSEKGIMRMEVKENGLNVMREVPVLQTNFNKKFLAIAKYSPNWRFVTDQPLGLGLHWFGDQKQFASQWYPRSTAREYVETGLCGDRSVQFVVGDGAPVAGQEGLDKKLAIVQAELPDENGNWVSSAHIVNVDRNIYDKGEQYFANATYSLLRDYGFSNPGNTTILERLYQRRYNDRPNIQLVGVEIQGCSFDVVENFPSAQKLANILAVSMAVIKRNKVSSPAYNVIGHEELDFGKGDPGKNLMFGMKMLIGVSALASGDNDLLDLVFKPFTLDGKVSKEEAVANYFKYCSDYFARTTGPESFVEYWSNKFQLGEVKKLLSLDPKGHVGLAHDSGY
jgi:hypothetical protein